ncbi:MAG: TfoX/Sxy family protein [Methylobacterium mesophilicum]|nr:TfoX/Sxy family protein [Methylobacterium mesophilicum]
MDDEAIHDIFETMQPISIRRMFGGKGIYRDGLIFGVVLRDALMLKGDDAIGPEWEAEGAVRWSYQNKTGKTVSMPYWTVPVDALEDREVFAIWARQAFTAALYAKRGGDDPDF